MSSMTYSFKVKTITEECIAWINKWFMHNGRDCNAYLGISGGKDSTICAALLKKALGGKCVYGVSMPDSNQGTNNAEQICKYLDINYVYAPIGNICDEFNKFNLSSYAQMNLPPRVRMTMLYALSQSNNGRVCETSNLSEWYLGYYTIAGDNMGDFSPLGKLTVTEVKQIGMYLGLPESWVNRIPDDGLPNSKPDEEKLGVKYSDVDLLIRTGELDSSETIKKILTIHNNSSFKEGVINLPTYDPLLPNLLT